MAEANDEHLAAHTHYVVEGNDEAFNHKSYQDKQVKDALIRLFNGKCAYCESKITITSPIDKEHFRPKTKINTGVGPKIRGYYWLAADWDNLLSACAHCNRTGTHETDLDDQFVAGKLDYFPLLDETKRAAYGNDLKEEEKVRLLINPCIDKPEKLISYNKDGEITPSIGITEKEEKMVQTSIDTFGLHRSELHKERREKWKDIEVQIERIKWAFNKYLQTLDEDFLDKYHDEMMELKRYKSINKEFLGVVRFLIRKELGELKHMMNTINVKK
ncbi:retron system putative HNH endonuclease [Salegentibacter mishustinae]|uniref:retron system putative HNH endonuclease n=1 Tax=Salegentibacter mishustinae TaxID=270918 RepID=UPI002493907D|nr:retron system putative HNH endonuclease [Salegentibacter mishustinae]